MALSSLRFLQAASAFALIAASVSAQAATDDAAAREQRRAQHLQQFEHRLDARKARIDQRLDERKAQIEQRIDQRKQNMHERIDAMKRKAETRAGRS